MYVYIDVYYRCVKLAYRLRDRIEGASSRGRFHRTDAERRRRRVIKVRGYELALSRLAEMVGMTNDLV